MSALLTVVEYTDPACPWAWGSEPKFQWLRAVLGVASCPPAGLDGRVAPEDGVGVVWRRVFGILFDDDEEPAPDPAAEAAWYLEELREISGHTGAPCPPALGWVSATSWPASLAAKAAERQGPQTADAVLRRLRETTFLDGRPADTPERVVATLRTLLPSLDLDRLAREAGSPEILAAVGRDRAETRSPCPEVFDIDEPTRHPGRAKPLGEDPTDGHRYALPTLVFEGSGGRAVAAGWRSRNEYLDAVRRAAPELSALCHRTAAASR
jgi:protein-disulfide isomerase-like protein with CxxC motif